MSIAQQLLVLLLVVEAQLDQRRATGPRGSTTATSRAMASSTWSR